LGRAGCVEGREKVAQKKRAPVEVGPSPALIRVKQVGEARTVGASE